MSDGKKVQNGTFLTIAAGHPQPYLCENGTLERGRNMEERKRPHIEPGKARNTKPVAQFLQRHLPLSGGECSLHGPLWVLSSISLEPILLPGDKWPCLEPCHGREAAGI